MASRWVWTMFLGLRIGVCTLKKYKCCFLRKDSAQWKKKTGEVNNTLWEVVRNDEELYEIKM